MAALKHIATAACFPGRIGGAPPDGVTAGRDGQVS
jgi:hypothetical protein